MVKKEGRRVYGVWTQKRQRAGDQQEIAESPIASLRSQRTSTETRPRATQPLGAAGAGAACSIPLSSWEGLCALMDVGVIPGVDTGWKVGTLGLFQKGTKPGDSWQATVEITACK